LAKGLLPCVSATTALKLEHFNHFGGSCVFLIRVVLGTQVDREFQMVDPLGLFFMFGFCIVVIVGILNILIVQILSEFRMVSQATQGYSRQHCAYICMHMESIMPIKKRKHMFDDMHFEIPVPFDHGDSGPSGGIQVIEPASVRNSVYYQPDRVLRYTGDASPSDPWPTRTNEEEMLWAYTDAVVNTEAGEAAPMAL